MIPLAEADGRKRFHILVIEDYEDAAQSMAMLLKLHDYQVDIARDGAQAIAAALLQRPDVILLDIGLPGGGDGYRVASTLRQEAPCKDTLIIAVSGYGQAEDRRRSHEAGIDHHLLKPVESSVLLKLLPPSEAAESPSLGTSAPTAAPASKRLTDR
jgi:CheY-like chemotaxis protein